LKQHNDTLIQYSIEKSNNALASAVKNLEIDLVVSQNRAYYAVFYIVLALAYSDGFTTGKHHQLMGWFNKKYIYENKIFASDMKEIYRKLLANREKFDYDVTETPELEEVKKNVEKAEYFIQKIKGFMTW
jgi:uncharacterized protein (UPF0332 family)